MHFHIVPTRPQNVRVLDVSSNSIKISWLEPTRANGVIHAYRVYYMFLNQTLLHLPMLKNDASMGPPFTYTLINLSEYSCRQINSWNLLSLAIDFHLQYPEPFTEYRIIVIAFTLKYDGEPSDSVTQQTDIAGPSAPYIMNLTCHSQDALYLQWRRPAIFYHSIDFYMINYRDVAYSRFQQIQINTTTTVSETAVSIVVLLSVYY